MLVRLHDGGLAGVVLGAVDVSAQDHGLDLDSPVAVLEVADHAWDHMADFVGHGAAVVEMPMDSGNLHYAVENVAG